MTRDQLIAALERADASEQQPRRSRVADCKRLVCQAYEIETEPPINPPLIACLSSDCERAIKAMGGRDGVA